LKRSFPAVSPVSYQLHGSQGLAINAKFAALFEIDAAKKPLTPLAGD
jgi:hypothetical protein